MLVALIAAPAISRRAFRLAAARARLLAPLSESQRRAERDALRGQYAIELTKKERRFEANENALALAQIELGVRTRKIAEMAAENARLRAEIDGYVRSLLDRNVEIGAREMALLDLTHQRNVAVSLLAVAESRIADYHVQSFEHRRFISSLEARIVSYTDEVADLRRESECAALQASGEIRVLTDNLAGIRAARSRLASQIADLEARHSSLLTEAEGRAAEATRLRQHVADLEPRLLESEKMRDALALEKARQTMRIAEREADLNRLQAAQRDEAERFQDRLEGATAREGELAIRVGALIAARVGAEEAIRLAKAERDTFSKELAGLRESLVGAEGAANSVFDGDADLRGAISRIGHHLTEQRNCSPAENSSDAELT